MRLWLDRMHEVGELDGLLDEEHRDVVADNIPVALDNWILFECNLEK
jgi:hypothetical protein